MTSIEEELNTSFPDERAMLLANILYTSGWLRNSVNAQLAPYEISSQQFNILRILRGNGDWLAMAEVKKKMVERSPNTTRLADKLLDKGLIERERCETDRRVVYIKISDNGLDLLKRIDDEMNFNLIEKLNKQEARKLSETLDKLRS